MSWKKTQIIGKGEFGYVFKAVPTPSTNDPSSVVAVKSVDFKSSEFLRDEANILGSLRGVPNIVHSYGHDISFENGQTKYNLLLEYAPGGSLETLIKPNALPEDVVASYVYQLLKGLDVMHALGIVHCDIKPGNILVFPTDDGLCSYHLKMADFGLAIRVSDNSDMNNHGCRGSVRYMSPECLKPRAHEASRDIWALLEKERS